MRTPEDTNPYRSPIVDSSDEREAAPPRNRLGELGFGLSLVAFTGLWLVTLNMLAICMVLACAPSTLISVVALFHAPRRLAAWGVAIGIFVGLYLPTLLFSILR